MAGAIDEGDMPDELPWGVTGPTLRCIRRTGRCLKVISWRWAFRTLEDLRVRVPEFDGDVAFDLIMELIGTGGGDGLDESRLPVRDVADRPDVDRRLSRHDVGMEGVKLLDGDVRLLREIRRIQQGHSNL